MIESVKSKQIVRYQKVCHLKKYRDALGLFCLEGGRLVLDGVHSGAHLETVLITEQAARRYAKEWETLRHSAACVSVISEQVARHISDVSSPQGIFALAKKLDKPVSVDTIKRGENFLALVQVRDPGNLGTMLRTADAFGFAGVLLCECCDVYSPKVVRGSMGAFFHLPIYRADDLLSFLPQWEKRGVVTLATLADQRKATSSLVFERGVLLVGNEANGLPEAYAKACKRSVTLPQSGRAESLNAAVAAGICMYEMARVSGRGKRRQGSF